MNSASMKVARSPVARQMYRYPEVLAGQYEVGEEDFEAHDILALEKTPV